jgi:general secretion pathway protein D
MQQFPTRPCAVRAQPFAAMSSSAALVLGLWLVAVPATAVPDDEPIPANGVPEAAPPRSAVAGRTAPSGPGTATTRVAGGAGGAMITPNYKDADLGQIIEAVSQLTGKNFIVDPRVKAQVTLLSATPMTPDAFYQAFLALLEVHGFVAVPQGKVIKVVPDANARTMPANDLPDRVSGTSDELVTQVIGVKNVSAAQLVPILRPLIPQYGHLAAYPSANVLIITDHAANVARMLKIIERIDQTSGDDIDIIHLEHASATETVRVINQLSAGQAAGEGGTPVKLIADDRTNSVLISGDKSARLRLRALVTHLDTPLTTGGETQVRYLKYADSEKISAKLKEQVTGVAATAGAAPGVAGGTGASERTVIWSDPATNSLIMTAPAKVMRTLNSVIDRLDIRRAQVQVEAIIVEITGDKSIDLGVNWASYAKGSNVPAAAFNSAVSGTGIGEVLSTVAAIAGGTSTSTSTTTTGTTASLPSGTTVAIGKINKNGTSFAALLRAVSGNANTNIISTPSVTTLDNQEAQIKVTQEVPFVTGQYTSGTTQSTGGVVNPFQTIQRQEVGIILKITPQITDDGTIMMKIEQEVSSLAQSSVKTVDVITNKRTISTKVLAEDGEVVVLGGLIQDNLQEGEQRVPFLGGIPILGELFRTRNTQKTKNNLMVFLRPTVLLDGAQVATETSAKYNYVRDIELSRNKGKAQLLPGEGQPVLPDLATLQPPVPPGTLPKAKGYKSKQVQSPGSVVSPTPPPPASGLPPADSETAIVPSVTGPAPVPGQ